MLTPEPSVRLKAPAEVAAMVPYLLGFVPTDSLVVIALAGNRVVCSARTGLPTKPDDNDVFRAVLDHLSAILVDHHATGALLVGYGPTEHIRTGVRVATAALRAVSLPVHHALRVADGRIFGISCATPTCCALNGTPFDPTSNLAAASAVAAGLVALPNREALAQQVAPITGPARTAFAAATHAAVQRLLHQLNRAPQLTGILARDVLALAPPGPAILREGKRAVAEALDVYRNGQILDTDRAATLTVLLHLTVVRDFAIARTTGDDWQISMWTDLLRRAERAFTAGPAILLALAALQAGNGPLASCAMERALDADPEHRLANLILQAIRIGIDPQTVATLTRA